MDDLISRQAVLDKAYVMDLIDTGNDIQVRVVDVDDIMRLPSEPRWIPVSEKLPEEGKKVLISIASDSYDGEWNIQTTLIVSMARRDDRYNRVFWHDYNMNIIWNDKAVTAWMPLPEPYKGGEK